ncbi:MAG TPA: Flp family type IVb pilin [Pirellulales bacterium]|jgi:Flp pilus assembly pilin Flp|nr:Flp family type IVb pilin [Pirellulales bacterium]
MRLLWRLLCDDDAATAVEYAVMLALILISVIAAISTVGAGAGGMWGGNQRSLNNVGFGS